MPSEKVRELGRLEDRMSFINKRMAEIRAEGHIAPSRTWIQRFVVPKKNGKRYYYYRLMEACDKKSKSGSIQGKLKLYLGNKHNPKYHDYKAAIRRRNELQELQRRYDKLTALYEKLLSAAVSDGFLEEVAIESQLERTKTNDRGLVASTEILKAVEGLQETVRQLCQWVVVIGNKLGVRLEELKFASN